MSRLLIIDSLNLFIRNYVVKPYISKDGIPIGGVLGYLQSLQMLVREMNPTEVVICWDAPGGSVRRKQKLKEYKAGRKPIRLNRSFRNLTEEQERENKIWQTGKVLEFLNGLPVIQLMVEGIEADDIIAYVSQHEKYKDWEQIIVSSDKDFFQLCTGLTTVYRPIQKKLMTHVNITEEHGIHPNNFALARAIVGDKSDNIVGIPRIGLKTVAKNFPFLSEDNSATIDDLMNHCEALPKKSKAITSILENRTLIEDNYKLMQLYVPDISPIAAQKISYNINEFEPEFNRTDFVTMLARDGFHNVRLDTLLSMMKLIVNNSNTKNTCASKSAVL